MRPHAMFALLALGTALARPVAAQQNPHGKLPAGLDCSDCHTPKSWKPDPATVKFDHDKQTRFPLTGRHRSTACRACHLDLSFDEPSLRAAECATCHADVHRGAYAERCAECHNTVSFSDVQARQVHARTTFPLTGAHLQIDCRACHVDSRLGEFTPLDPQCVACHRTQYEQAQPIDHVASGFPVECQQCHSTIAWSAYVHFDHPSVSGGFRLLGAHERIRCESCHDANLGPLFQPANDQDCIACHQPDYQRGHPGGGFPTTCVQCHSVDTWEGATFDHAQLANGFRLLGAHARLDCSSCHAADMTPLFTPANDQDCLSCHDADYQREHGGTGFPTTCLTCHTVDNWNADNFTQHDQLYFPIFSGRHAGTWQSCQTCHTQSNDYLVFSCFACHQQAQTDSHHREVRNYRYDSQACYQCHPNGRGGD